MHAKIWLCVGAALLVLMSAGCGRIGYDPLGSGGVDASNDESALLASLVIGGSQPELLMPAFAPTTSTYASQVALVVDSLSVTATAMDSSAQVEIESVASGTGTATGFHVIDLGPTEIHVTVTTSSGATGANGNETDNSATGSGAVYVFD